MDGRPKFQREDRYVVIKLKHLKSHELVELNDTLRKLDLPEFRCVVIEEDWPIYEQAWRLIENLWRKARGIPLLSDPIPTDVSELVDAARVVAFEDQSYPAIKRLDKATEAFASRVPWRDEPEETKP